MIFTFQLSGCTSTSSKESKIKIREIAYEWLDDNSKSEILNFNTATIEEVTFTEEHILSTKTDSIDIKDIKTYKVIFNTTKDELLGPIVVYLSKDNLTVLGIDFRE